MNRFTNILAYVQGDPGDDSGLRRATELARLSRAHLHLMAVVGDERSRSAGRLDGDILWEGQQRRNLIERHAEALRAEGLDVEVSVRYGRPSKVITKKVIDDGHDVVFKMANPGDGVPSWRRFGDTAVRLMRLCPCPVWVTRQSEQTYRRILVAIDPIDVPERRALNDAVMRFAIALSKFTGSEVHVVHAWEAVGVSLMGGRVPDSELRDYVATTRRSVTRAVREYLLRFRPHLSDISQPGRVHISCGVPEHRIPEVAAEVGASVVVMGTFARTGLSGYLIGNTSEKVLPNVDASVVTLKFDGFRSPLEKHRRQVA